MGIKVNLDECIGCGVCAQLCPETFKLDENEGKCVVLSQEVTPESKEAVDSCPVSAIIVE
jgi:ferredoxin